MSDTFDALGECINARARASARLTEAWNALHTAKTQEARDRAAAAIRSAEAEERRARAAESAAAEALRIYPSQGGSTT